MCRDFARACSDHELYADADDAAVKPRYLVADGRFDREGDLPPGIPWSDTVIYETRVRGLTIHPSSAVRHPGTFQGVIEKIPYLRQLGVTAIELLPVIICV